ncbi:MAG: response regulator [Deltaproteobacteria bacterium]|nr:response regulator [Deltaproteobacteria bacterium]
MKKSAVKILLVDDSDVMLGYLAALLSKQGLEVATATSLVTAVDAFCRTRPQLILMDFVLEPTRTGLETLAAIFSVAGAVRPLAAILTQGALTPADEQKASDWGVAVLQKPVRGKEADFLALVDQLVKKVPAQV